MSDDAAVLAWGQRVEAIASAINVAHSEQSNPIDLVAACLLVSSVILTNALSRVHPNAQPASVLALVAAIDTQVAIWAKLNAPPDPADALILPRGIRH